MPARRPRRQCISLTCETAAVGGCDTGGGWMAPYAAASILAEIEKVRSQKRYDASALVDWYVKLARVAKRYAKLDQERPDFVEVRAELSRLNPEQLLTLKQLALVASGGATSDSLARNTTAGVRRTIQGTTRSDRTRKDPSELR
jgi:hypothetical protein